MSDMNVIVLTGRLTKDALKKTPGQTQLVTFDIANNTGYGEYAKVAYYTVNLWGKQGDGVYQYLKKGKQVGIIGELTFDTWTGRDDGVTHTKPSIRCNQLTLLGGNQTQTGNVTEVEAEVVDDFPGITF